MKKIILAMGFFLLGYLAQAAKVDTVLTRSNVMSKQIKAVVIRPDAYDGKTELPVVYLLHGYSGNYADWIKQVPAIQQMADLYQFMIVCPDGGFGSWYLDSPEDPSFQYETYVTKELIPWIDQHYKTIKNRKGRAITGLSMGGHGALYLAFRHQDLFGAAGSISGGVDIRPFPNNWDLAKRLGTYAAHPDNWEKNTVTNLLYLLEPNQLALMIDCGTEDFFYGVNLKLHQKLLKRNIPHDYIARPGAHTWTYWANSIPYQLLFMHRFFTAK
ncbi:alpha/beta hydrolase family protein [Olivibacter ginsenosidimutans]|uniref:Alpha/beta hydrolase family protein n=1 Tax=Olivibacter ginsenosidimutans TaxID=1176537 RepID=A0ABP9BAQ6_9SPHI